VQIDSEGKVRVIRTMDTQGEELAWVEKNVIQQAEGNEDGEIESGGDDVQETSRGKRPKTNDVIDLTR